MQERKPQSDLQVLLFVVALCCTCALLLALAAFGLEKAQIAAKEFDQSKQMLIAAKILNHEGYFVMLKEGTLTRARWDEKEKILVSDEKASRATDEQITQIATSRIHPLLTDSKGDVYTFEEKNLTLPEYLAENKKKGYANLPLKLFYAISSNEKEDAPFTKELTKVSVFVFPVSGFGLWAPIYGYLAVSPDGDDVIGTTWYEHGETPGLGANITEPWWQKQFYGKVLFQETSGGTTDFQTADMGIVVVKGKVKDVFGDSVRAKSAVDGMSGATLTGDGVTQAYRNSLTPYRNFLIKVHQKHEL